MELQNVVLIAIILNSAFGSVEEEWAKFKLDNNKSYQSLEEHHKRVGIFTANLVEINEHNKMYEKGLVTYQKGINKYGDLTAEEFLNLYNLRFRKPKIYDDARPNVNIIPTDSKDRKGAEHLDWREKGAVTPAKDHGTCGSCWIFSAVGALEGYYFRTHKKLISLSEQNMVDCISNSTCSGGWPPMVLYYVHSAGINTEEDYPYEAKHVKCRYDKSRNVNITFSDVHPIGNSEDELKKAVTNYGPVLVAVCATSEWRFYENGVWYEKRCCEQPNHSVLVVGYGRENGNDYWLIKNSMGSNWGDSGFMKVARNKHQNYCGLTRLAYYVN